MERVKSSKYSLHLILIIFILPFVLAFLIYKYQFIDFATKNYGYLVYQKLQIDNVLDPTVTEGKWRLIYSDPNLDNRLSKVKIALGKDQNRIHLLKTELKLSNKHFVLIDPKNSPVLLYHKDIHKDVGKILLDLKNLLRYSYAG